MVPAQTITSYKQDNAKKGIISGIVHDKSGEVIIGAIVFIEESKDITVTDLDGYFELVVNIGDNIKVVYPGYISYTEKLSKGDHYDSDKDT